KALEGMQPTFRQTPPNVAYRSTSTTDRPRSAARNAAEYPPGPAPSTRTSHWTSAEPEKLAAAGAEAGLSVGFSVGLSAAGFPAAVAPDACVPETDGAGAAALPSSDAASSICTMAEPSVTLSPTLTSTALTTPALAAGISMDALSDSTVI